jgi:hypothetical protein
MVKNNPKKIDNKFEFAIGLLKYWRQTIAIMITAGIIYFALQIKHMQCGNVIIEKQPLETPKKLKELKK